ncbi:WYL domain-containing protein [Spirosoma litoris]
MDSLVEKVAEELKVHHHLEKGISRRQIQEDIKIMRSDPPMGYEAPIVCRAGCYYYEDYTFSIEKKALNNQDLNSLNEALGLLRQFRGVPHLQDIEQILVKMEGKVRYNDPGEEIISFEQIDLLKGYEFIPIVYSAIREEKALTVGYQAFQSTFSSIFEVHPYYLKEYRGRWYAFSWVSELNKITNLALDRVVIIKPALTKYRLNQEFDPVVYFSPIVGVTLPEGGEEQNVKIKVAPSSASYIRSKPIHLSQLEEESVDQYSIFTYKLIPNFEFEAELLRLGEAVEVLSPTDFRTKLQQRLSDALTLYKIPL